jgi:hypothetical protein
MCEIPAQGKEREVAIAAPPKAEPAKSKAPPRRSPAPTPPALVPMPTPEALPPSMLPDLNIEYSNEDDGKPYAVSGGLPKPCPNCNKPLEPQAKVCVACEYDFEAGKTPEKVYTPFDREWESGATFGRRLRYFLLLVVAFFFLGLVGTISSGEWLSFILSWLTFAGMLAFVFGTFDRVSLSRNARGQVRLSHAWRFCFVNWTSARVPLKDYDAVVSGRVSESSMANILVFGFLVLSGVLSTLNLALNALARDRIHPLEWVGMLILMLLGFVPAAIAYYMFFHKMSFYVALSEGHDYPSKHLYKGWSEEHMRELAETVGEVTTVPYHRG